MDLLERLKKLRYEEDISYKEVAKETGIPLSTLYNFTSGARELRPKLRKVLEQYLKSMQY